MNDYRRAPLWQSAFAEQNDGLQDQRTKLVTAYAECRERVSLLVGQIHKDMPDLTVHDISHIDALWWIASEIAGEGYPLNPAEAFVLGGAFLLHDAAHCRVAYPGGIDEIRALPEWREFAAGKGDLEPGTSAFQMVLFDVLRSLHPKQARQLASLSWQAPGDPTPLFLLSHDELRMAYADAIGRLAESHWWSPHELETFDQQRLTAPACLHPATWDVDLLKLAVLLRTADAAMLIACLPCLYNSHQRDTRSTCGIHLAGGRLVVTNSRKVLAKVPNQHDSPVFKPFCMEIQAGCHTST